MPARSGLFAHLGVSVFALNGLAQAGPWQESLTAAYTGEWDSNPRMSLAADQAVWRHRVAPDFQLSRRSDETEFDAGIGMKIERSSEKARSADRNDAKMFLSGRRIGPLATVELAAKYEESTTLTADSPDPGAIDVEVSRVAETISGKWLLAASERVSLVVDTQFSQVGYDNPIYVDYSNVSASGDIRYALSERSKAFVRFAGGRYRSDSAVGTDSYYSKEMIGGSWSVSPRFEISAQGGVSRRDGASGSEGTLTGGYRAEKATASFEVSRVVVPTGAGGYVQVDQAMANWTVLVDEKTAGSIAASVKEFKSATPNTLAMLSASLDKALSRHWKVRLAMQRKSLTVGTAATASSNLLGISLSYSYNTPVI